MHQLERMSKGRRQKGSRGGREGGREGRGGEERKRRWRTGQVQMKGQREGKNWVFRLERTVCQISAAKYSRPIAQHNSTL